MKLEIDCAVLKNELDKIKDVVSARNTMPLLSNALFEATEDNRLTIKATDLDISIITSCEANVIEPGSVTIQAVTLLRTVSTIKNGAVTIEVEDNFWAKVSAEKFSCRIAGTHAKDFPTMTDTSDFEYYSIDAELMLNMIAKTEFSISQDDNRSNFSGAFFKTSQDRRFLMVTTDGHRLSRFTSEPDAFDTEREHINELRNGVIIPAKAIKMLSRNVEPGAFPLSFALTKTKIAFQHGPMTIITRLIDGSFPLFNQIIPRDNEHHAVCDRASVLYAVEFAQLFANKKSNRLKFTLSTDNLNIYASDPETGEGSKDVEIDYDGPEVVVGFNAKYIVDFLRALDGDTVEMQINEHLNPTVIEDPNDNTILYVLMPMRV